jgi:hypothetical protein
MVSTVLLGWELGAGFGHVTGLLEIARALSQHGLQPVLALRDLRGPWPLLRDCPFPVLQTPRLSPMGDASFSARSFDDILAASGFGDAEGLASVLRGWDGLLDTVRPSVVVTNHAPALSLAAYGVIPTVVTGTGFTVPPGNGPEFPTLVSGPRSSVVAGWTEVVREVLAARDRPAPAHFTELYRDNAYPLTVPELDPYRPVRAVPVAAPLRALPAVVSAPASEEFFAYLSAGTPWAETALAGMAGVARGGAYLRGAREATLQRLEATGLRMWRTAPPLGDVLRTAGIVVHHGGHATAQAALAAGRPQLCLPRHLEQSLNGHLLEQLGVARVLRGELPPEAPVAALVELRADAWADRARDAAVAIAARQDPPSVELLADRCVALAAR